MYLLPVQESITGPRVDMSNDAYVYKPNIMCTGDISLDARIWTNPGSFFKYIDLDYGSRDELLYAQFVS